MRRWTTLLYGIAGYVLFLGVFLYLVGFIGGCELAGFATPTALDGPRTTGLGRALAVDGLLVALFAVQHSVMARPRFKAWLTRYVPHAAERSTYVLATNAALLAMFVWWEPLGGRVWSVEHEAARAVIWCLYAAGWATVLVTTFLINHFDLFGLRQVWLEFRGREYTALPFVTPGPYRFIRHPLYVGWLLVFWSAPTMTASHLAFALGMTAYILIAIVFEERDLVRFHPGYAEYRRKVPMFVPRLARMGDAETSGAGAALNPSPLRGEGASVLRGG